MKKFVLDVGHKEKAPGARNAQYGTTEFEFNRKLANDIKEALKNEELDIHIFYRTMYKTLPHEINLLKPNYVISLHANAFNTKASGTMVLYYYISKSGKRMAEILQSNLLKALGLKDRGIQGRNEHERGGSQLKHVIAPTVIAEPFFIDNDSDLHAATVNYDALVKAYVDTILEINSTF